MAITLAITLAESTPYMLRYNLNITGTSGTATPVIIANDTTTASPNMLTDSLQGSPIQKAINVGGLSGVASAFAALINNPALRVTFTSNSSVVTYGADTPDPTFHNGRPVYSVDANSTLGGPAHGTMTIEIRHTEAR